MSRRVAIVVAVALVVIAAFLVGRRVRGNAEDRGPVTASGASETPSPSVRPDVPTRGDHARGGLEARRRMVEAIAAAREQRLHAAPSAPGGADWGTYMGETLDRALGSLVNECYQEALVRDPTLEGTITIDFKVIGEPDVGGAIETSEIDPRYTTITGHEDFADCVRESVFALTLPAPPSGGTITVNVPYVLIPTRGAVKPRDLGERPTVNGVPL